MCYSSSSPPLYCMFLPTSSDWILLKDYKDVFFSFFFLFHVTICCRWDGHVILLLTVVRFDAFAAQDAGVQQLLPVRWWADVSVGLIISWETEPQANDILQALLSYRPQRGKKKVQFWVSQWKGECIWTAAIVAFQQNIDCYYGITGTQRAHAQNKREAPKDLVEDVCYDLMRSQRLGNVCVKQRVTNHFTADCFREKTAYKGIGEYTERHV